MGQRRRQPDGKFEQHVPDFGVILAVVGEHTRKERIRLVSSKKNSRSRPFESRDDFREAMRERRIEVVIGPADETGCDLIDRSFRP